MKLYFLRFFLQILAVLCANTLLSQKTLLNASITTNDGVTLHGKIDYGGWWKPLEKIKFGQDDRTLANYGINDLQAISITQQDGSQERYLRRVVNLEVSPQKSDLLTKDKGPVFMLDTAWLLLLYQGKYNLFSYRDNSDKWHYFIEEKGKEPIELFKKLYLKEKKGKMTIEVVPYYKIYLDPLIISCNKAHLKLLDGKLTRQNLMAVLELYHECENITPDYVWQPEKLPVEVMLAAGTHLTTLDDSRGNVYPLMFLREAKWDNPLGWHGGLGINLPVPGTKKHISIYNELLASRFEMTGKKEFLLNSGVIYEVHDYHIAQTSLMMNNLVGYTFFTKKFNLNLQAGSSFNHVFKTSHYFKDDFSGVVNYEGDLFEETIFNNNIAFVGGIQLARNRLGLAVRYHHKLRLSDRLKTETFTVTASYRLFKFTR
ncbi:MAG: hypothetical protein HY842_15365 [Bacteroidetes bacterium]|nr:hypothetical protein [Bacteroidota bacterium]